jgi:hypothetical protein
MFKKDKDDFIIGKQVIVKKCEAREHGDNPGCVCDLIGKTVKITKKYKTPYAGTPSYHIKGTKQRVRRSEVRVPREKKK